MHVNEPSPHLSSFVVNVSWQCDYGPIISPSHSSASHLSPTEASNISQQINALVRGCVGKDTWRWWVFISAVCLPYSTGLRTGSKGI